jgi:hypothetical protein
MPRGKPFRCHTCGTLYTGGRCPKCHPPKKGRGISGRTGRPRSGRRWTAASVLGHEPWPVDVPDVVMVEDSTAQGERRTDGTCTTTPELQVQECDRVEAGSVVSPPQGVVDATD